MYIGCIELLCLTDSFKSADIPIVEKIIESKWELVGRPLFLIRFYVHLFLLVGVTIIGFLINHTPTRNPTILPEYIVSYFFYSNYIYFFHFFKILLGKCCLRIFNSFIINKFYI